MVDLIAARYVLVHHELMVPDHAARVDRLLNGHPRLRRWVGEGDLVAFRVATLDAAARQFRLQEATVGSIHAAFAAGQLTCTQLTRLYLDRIEAYDLRGPTLHAIITVHPKAMEMAAEMDRGAGEGVRCRATRAAESREPPRAVALLTAGEKPLKSARSETKIRRAADKGASALRHETPC